MSTPEPPRSQRAATVRALAVDAALDAASTPGVESNRTSATAPASVSASAGSSASAGTHVTNEAAAVWRSSSPWVQSRYVGCLVGGAVGDALGAPVEFLRRAEIVRQFGERGITDYAPAYGGVGRITDDTQMTLFTAEGLLRGHLQARARGCANGTKSLDEATARAYLRWLHTQGQRAAIDRVQGLGAEDDGWLVTQRALHSRRAPGNTCLSALAAMRAFGAPATNDSKGCGGVMRVAPAGLFTAAPLLAEHLWPSSVPPGDPVALRRAFDLGARLARLTHGHPSGYLPGGVLAAVVHALVMCMSLDAALDAACALLAEREGHEETSAALSRARELAGDRSVSPAAAIARLGEGWVAEEALAIAVYCALVAPSFDEAVILAVNHDGDSDSTGAIVGNMLGARRGVEGIPYRWLAPLELWGVIEEMGLDLLYYPGWDEPGDERAHALARYPVG